MDSAALDLEDVRSCRRLMAWAVAAWLIGFFPPAMVVTIPFQLYGVYRMTRALRFGVARTSLFMAITLVPIVCLLIFVGLRQQAERVLRAAPERVDQTGFDGHERL